MCICICVFAAFFIYTRTHIECIMKFHMWVFQNLVWNNSFGIHTIIFLATYVANDSYPNLILYACVIHIQNVDNKHGNRGDKNCHPNRISTVRFLLFPSIAIPPILFIQLSIETNESDDRHSSFIRWKKNCQTKGNIRCE